MRISWSGSLRAFVVDTRASAGIELGLGAVVLLGIAMLCFDLYSRVEADTKVARIVATMADYVSRGPDTDGGSLDGAELKALAAFLHANELGAGTDLVLVMSAINIPEEGAGELLWSDDTLRFGDVTVTEALAAGCTRVSHQPVQSGSPSDLDKAEVVVEACARLSGAGSLTGRFVSGDIYRLHVLPARAPGKGLPAPVYAWRFDGVADAVARA